MFVLIDGHFFGRSPGKGDEYNGNDHRGIVFDQPVAGRRILHGRAGKLDKWTHKIQDDPDKELGMGTHEKKKTDLAIATRVWFLADQSDQGDDDHDHEQDQDKISQVRMQEKKCLIHDVL